MKNRISILLQATLFLAVLAYALDDSAPRRFDLTGSDPEDLSVPAMMVHLREIAKEPHYIGTEAHARVREYIYSQFLALGLETEISEHTMPGELRLGSSNGKVFNILSRLEGTDGSDKAVLVAAHYDSVPTAPGAADDGAGVASMIEVARWMKSGKPPKNDIIFLVTDAEEVCLCGAKAFVEEHRWAKDVGVVLNFEARGNKGASIMFETSEGNAELIGAFSQFARAPSTNSLTYEVYKRLPNDTDLTMFRKGGMPGLNFAFIGALKYYHSPEDTPDNISLRSLAHHGNNMLDAARFFGDVNLGDLSQQSQNAVYFDFALLKVIHYPIQLGWLLAGLAVALWLVSLMLGIRAGRFTLKDLLRQMALVLFLTLMTPLIAWGVGFVARLYFVSVSGIPRIEVLTSKPLFLGLMLGMLMFFWHNLRRHDRCLPWFPGAGLWLLLFSPVVSVLIPGAGYLFTWPLMFLALAQCVQYAAWSDRHPIFATIFGCLCQVPGIVILGTTLNGVFTAMTLAMFPVQVFLALLMMMPVFAQLSARR